MEVELTPMLTHVTDPSHAGEARRHAAVYAEKAKLGEREQGALGIVVTEIATNLIKHAGSGMVMIESIQRNGDSGVRVIGLDKGPGIRDLTAALQDGYSSVGTQGNGLGAIKRLSHAFDIYTSPGLGTAVLAEFWPHERIARKHVFPLEVGVLSIPMKGEDVCGDGWGVKKSADSLLFMVVDGLGHGVFAADGAREAERVFAQSRDDSLTTILQDCHDALKKTRGAAMAVVSLRLERRLLSFAGIGNIGSSLVTPVASRGMPSHNGTVGHHVSKIQEFTFPWNADSILVMHSDGLKTTWNLDHYPGIWNKHPALIAGILYRDFTRDRDDVTVLVAKCPTEASLP